MELVIASTNLHKVREFREMLKAWKHLDVMSLLNFPQYEQPPETETSYKENATLKATHAAQALNKWVLADDSGLVVPSLEDAPGVYSARFAGEEATDQENRQKLLKLLEGKHDLERSAYF